MHNLVPEKLDLVPDMVFSGKVGYERGFWFLLGSWTKHKYIHFFYVEEKISQKLAIIEKLPPFFIKKQKKAKATDTLISLKYPYLIFKFLLKAQSNSLRNKKLCCIIILETSFAEPMEQIQLKTSEAK